MRHDRRFRPALLGWVEAVVVFVVDVTLAVETSWEQVPFSFVTLLSSTGIAVDTDPRRNQKAMRDGKRS